MKKWISVMLAVLLLGCLFLAGCGANAKLEGKFYHQSSMSVYYEFTSASKGNYVNEDMGINRPVTYKMVKLDEGQAADYLVFVTDDDGKEFTFMYTVAGEELYEVSMGTFSKNYLLK